MKIAELYQEFEAKMDEWLKKEISDDEFKNFCDQHEKKLKIVIEELIAQWRQQK